MTQEELDAILRESVPKEDLTEDEFNEAKKILETSGCSLDVEKYIHSIRPEKSFKWVKCYFDLYIDDRSYDKV